MKRIQIHNNDNHATGEIRSNINHYYSVPYFDSSKIILLKQETLKQELFMIPNMYVQV